MKKLLCRIFGFNKIEKSLHFTDSVAYFEGVEKEAWASGELSL